MSRREKRLAILTAVMVVAVLGRTGMRRIAAVTDARENNLAALRQRIAERQLDVARGEKAAKRLAYWQRRSLPTDRDSAVGVYAQWLHDRLAECGISEVNVTSRAGVADADSPQLLTFTVDGVTRLRKLAQFLFSFYRAGHLHKVRSLRLNPVESRSAPGNKDENDRNGGRKLDVHLVIEAMILPGADRTDRLATVTSDRLRWPEAKPYVDKLATRDIFAEPRTGPDRAAEAAVTAQADRDRVAKQIVVTALFGNGSAGQVWLNVRTTGRTLKLAPGDPFAVEGVEGTVTAIAAGKREVVITTGGKRLCVRLGETLADGKPSSEKQG